MLKEKRTFPTHHLKKDIGEKGGHIITVLLN
jgi:hypothetical protein